MPKFSIIMPTYNRAAIIKRAIDSVFLQTYQDFELIVIDDGSTDNTREILESISDERVKVMYQQNAGPAAARNKGIEVVGGEIITYLDSDNTWHPNFLQVIADELIEPYVAVYTGQNLLLVDGSIEHPKVIGRKTRSETYNPALLERGNYIDIGCFAHTAKLTQTVGTFDASQPWAEDWDLIARIAVKYPFYIKHIDQVLSDYYAYLPGVLPTMTNQTEAWSDGIKAYFGVAAAAERDRKLSAHVTEQIRKQYPL